MTCTNAYFLKRKIIRSFTKSDINKLIFRVHMNKFDTVAESKWL